MKGIRFRGGTKMKKIRFVLLALIVSAFMIMVGCGKDTDSSNGKSGGDDGDSIELSFMGHGSTDEKKIFEAVIKSFEDKYSNVKVKYTSVPPGEYAQKLSTLIASGSQPDVYYAAGPE